MCGLNFKKGLLIFIKRPGNADRTPRAIDRFKGHLAFYTIIKITALGEQVELKVRNRLFNGFRRSGSFNVNVYRADDLDLSDTIIFSRPFGEGVPAESLQEIIPFFQRTVKINLPVRKSAGNLVFLLPYHTILFHVGKLDVQCSVQR